ncbi:MAG: DNRLRE domain-containing protein [Chloroflexi bacterium]|nr:DNRLRE domain-containing protein [Chloroflexota bacterium]
MARAKWALGAGGLAALLLLALLAIPGRLVTGQSGSSLLGYLAGGETGVEAGPDLPAPAPAPLADDDAAQRLIDLVNAARAAEGLLPLKRAEPLMADALRHAQDMASADFFGPEDAAGRAPLARLDEQGYLQAEHLAINLAAGLPDPDSVFQAWMAAAPYRRNILDPRPREIGVGYACDADDRFGPYAHYWTLALGARRGVYPVVIANEAATTAAAQVELAIHGAGWARQIAVSNSRLFGEGQLQPHQPRLAWTLDASQPESTVYVALVGPAGETVLVTDTIRAQGRVVELRRDLHGYQGVADAAITSWQPDRNGGHAPALELGAAAEGGHGGKEALVRFDLAALPASALLQRATLTLRLVQPPAAPLTLEAYALAAPWEERAATWYQAAPGILWGLPGAAQPGADRQKAPLGAWTVPPASDAIELDLTPLVQAWLARPELNQGVLLSARGGGAAACAVAASEHSQPALRPTLTLYLRPN